MFTQISVPESQKKESHEASAAGTSQSDCFTQRNSLFNKEVLQVRCSEQRYQYEELFTVSQGKLHLHPALLCSFIYLEISKMYVEGVLFFQSAFAEYLLWIILKWSQM